MAGLEVVGGISGVITIIDETVKIWKSVRKDLKLSETFECVGTRLPILRDTLQTSNECFETIQSTLPTDAAQALRQTIEDCKINAQKLYTVFEKTLPGGNDEWYDRYRKEVLSLGKGSRVEELMNLIAKSTQDLVNYHSVKSLTPELNKRLEEIIMEMKAAPSSLPDGDVPLQTFDANGGTQNISMGDVILYEKSNPGPVSPTSTKFTGFYSHFSWHPVLTYVSRPDLERRLEEQLSPLANTSCIEAMRTVVVWGLGGTGKSQLVLDYTHKRQDRYQHRFWVDAGSKQTLERDYLQIYHVLFSHTSHQPTSAGIGDTVTAVKRWIHEQEDRLLWVMDNADAVVDNPRDPNFIDLNYYLPDGSHLDRIVTTRNPQMQDISSQEGIEVKEMTDDEAMLLFRTCAKLQQPQQIVEHEVKLIVQELGCLALAVKLAASYVRETPQLAANIELYLPIYRMHRETLLGREACQNLRLYNESVLSTWEMSFAAIERQSSLAARLLTVLAFINFNDIFLELFAVCTGGLQPSDTLMDKKSALWIELLLTGEQTPDQLSIENSFTLLQEYSLVSWHEERAAYFMDKQVHAWGRDRLEASERCRWSLAMLQLLAQAVTVHENSLSVSTRLLPHVIDNFGLVSAACGPKHQTTAQDRDSLHTVGKLLHRLGQWNDEYKIRAYLLPINQLALGNEHLDTVTSMDDLASVLREQGQYKEAAAIHQQTLEIRRRVQGPEHPDTLTIMANLASILEWEGKYERSVAMHQQTLELRQKVLGPEHPDVLTSMNNLAATFMSQGRHEEAAKIHQRLLEVRQKELGPEHPDLLLSMSYLAQTLENQGSFESAVAMHRQILRSTQKISGSKHPDTLRCMNNLGLALKQQGTDYEEAIVILRQAVELMQKTLGFEHPSTLMCMNNLASALSSQGGEYERKEAIMIHQEVLEIREVSLGQEHPHTITSMNNLAVEFSKEREYERAAAILRQVTELARKVFGPEHPHTLGSMRSLADVLRWQSEQEQATIQ